MSDIEQKLKDAQQEAARRLIGTFDYFEEGVAFYKDNPGYHAIIAWTLWIGDKPLLSEALGDREKARPHIERFCKGYEVARHDAEHGTNWSEVAGGLIDLFY